MYNVRPSGTALPSRRRLVGRPLRLALIDLADFARLDYFPPAPTLARVPLAPFFPLSVNTYTCLLTKAMALLQMGRQRGLAGTRHWIGQPSRCVPNCKRTISGQAATPRSKGYALTMVPLLAGLSVLAWYSSSKPLQAEDGSGLPPNKVAPEAAKDPQGKLISMDEVSQHDSPQKGIWVAIEGEVYDISDFVDAHPGGKNVILKHAGQDVTEVYTPVHPANAIAENLSSSQHLGQVDPSSVKVKQPGPESENDRKRREARENLPLVGSLLNLDDFEVGS